ncbi:MAG: GNAT family N-acetyltransferase [Hydrogenovibrio sp.]
MDAWLHEQALKNQVNRGSRTFVVCEERRVLGYYALASGSVERINLNGSLARNMPKSVPVIVLGRLAVDKRYQGLSLGRSLLKDALLRCVQVANQIGVKAVLVHALDANAVGFYEKYGFQRLPNEAHTLVLSIANIERNI